MYRGGPGDWRGPPMPAQFAFRVAVLGGVALVVFAIIFLRLWYLEVLSGDQYLAEAQNNQVREFTVQAPRGEILDRHGQPAGAEPQPRSSCRSRRRSCPQTRERRARLFDRRRRARRDDAEARSARGSGRRRKEAPREPGDPAAGRAVRHRLLPAREPAPLPRASRSSASTCAATRRGRSPRTCSATCARSRPSSSRTRASRPRARRLRRHAGRRVDLRQPAARGERRHPGPGRRLGDADRADARRSASRAPATTSCSRSTPTCRRPARARSGASGCRAAFVAMNVNNGEILGMGSTPTYDPSVFAKPMIPPATLRADLRRPRRPDEHARRARRSTARRQGFYPTGSTFKPITALAALDSGVLELAGSIVDGGSVDLRRRRVRERRRGRPRSRRPAPRAAGLLRRLLLHPRRRHQRQQEGDGGPIQDWARSLGLGAPTGLDVGRRGRGPRADTGGAQRSVRAEHRSGLALRRGRSTSRRASSPTAPGRSATTSTSPSARATCRPTRCRWRSPTRRSPTAARSCARTSACGSRTRRDARSRRSTPAPRRQVEIDPDWQRDDHATASTTPRWRPAGPRTASSAAIRSRSPARPGPPSARPTRDQSWYVALAPVRRPEVRGRDDDRGGRLRRRRGRARDAGDPQRAARVEPAKIDDVSAEAAVVE